MARRVLESPHCSVKMEAHFLQIKMLSWKGEQITSMVSSNGHKVLMTIQSTDSRRQSAMFCLMHFQPSWKQEKQFKIGKAPDSDAVTASVYKVGGLRLAEKLTEMVLNKLLYVKKEAIPQNEMKIHKSVTITEASLSLQ